MLSDTASSNISDKPKAGSAKIRLLDSLANPVAALTVGYFVLLVTGVESVALWRGLIVS